MGHPVIPNGDSAQPLLCARAAKAAGSLVVPPDMHRGASLSHCISAGTFEMNYYADPDAVIRQLHLVRSIRLAGNPTYNERTQLVFHAGNEANVLVTGSGGIPVIGAVLINNDSTRCP